MNPDAPLVEASPRRSRGRPRKTAGERDDGNRRQALLRAAARLFRQQGFSATSTRDIAAAVGMRSGSPFYHFESKEALLAAVMEEGMERALAHQRERMAAAVAASRAPLTARECLRVLVRGHFDNLLGPESDHIPVMLYEWRVLSDEQKRAVNRLKDEYEAVWMPVLQTLRREGALAGDPRIARLMLFGALNWAAQWYVPDGRATLDDLTETTLQLFLKDRA
jgi:AcrR family transcriptional regulator